jgi:uncharacterized protein YbjT (DUF2867 family)
MSDRKIIAVLGATGAQGGGLVRAIQNDPQGGFQARVITRDPSSGKAREFASMGAQVVAADVDDPAGLERAFAGAHGAYCVTFYWAHMSPEKESAQALSMAQAAKGAGLKHVIWSTLEDTRRFVPLTDTRMPTLMERYKVPHFDAKGESDARFADLGVPTTYLLTTFYWDNFIHFGMGPRREADGSLVLALPLGQKRLAGIAAEDIGRCAYGIFREGGALVGQRVGIAGELLTGAGIAAVFSRALGQPVRYQAVPFDVYRGLGFPGADDLGNMFQFYHDFEQHFADTRDPARARALNPALQTLESFLVSHRSLVAVG